MVAATPTPIAKLRAAMSDQWMADRAASVADRIRGNYYLSPETEADPGEYDLENNPYWVEPLECFNNRKLRNLDILKSTQVGGTISTQGALLATATINPSPCMYVTPLQDEATTQRDRIYNNALASRSIFRRLVPPQSQWNNKHIDLGPMRVYLAWAKSKQRLRGKPCRVVIFNECDVYDYSGDAGNPVLAGRERTKQFKYTYLIVKESTPVGEDSEIWKSWEQSDKHRWHVACPHCGTWQDLRFFVHKSGPFAGCGGVAGYRDDSGNLLEPDEARRSAYYSCVKGCRIEQQYKTMMVRSGRWVADGQRIDDQGNLIGEPSARDRSHRGYHIWTIMQHKISIGEIAAEFVNAVNNQKLRDFFQNWLGLRFSEHKKPPSWTLIARRYSDESYSWGLVPANCWFVTAAADVQADRVWWMAVAWAPMRTPYIIDIGRLMRSRSLDESFGLGDEEEAADTGIILSADLLQLPAAMINRRWPVVNGRANPLGLPELMPILSGVDSNYRTHEVHEFIRRLGLPQTRLRALRGDDKVKPSERYRLSRIDRNSRTGKPYEGGLEQWQIYRTLYQDNLTDRLRAAPDQPGALRLPANVLPRGKHMLRQFTNLRKNKKGHYEVITRELGKDNPDLIGYCEALADMVVGNRGWTEAALIAWRNERMSRRERRASRSSNQSPIFER